MAELTMRATRPGSRVRRPKTHTPGRVCGFDSCDTVISRYNQSEYCFKHAPVKYPRLRGVLSEEFQRAEV